MSTVGFGDIVPQTEIARILTVLLVPLAVFAFAQSAESIAESFEMAAIRAREKQLMMKPLDLGDLLRMDLDKNGRVSREEFTLFMLMTLGRIDIQDILIIHEQFSRFDVTGEGTLDGNDLYEMEEMYASLMEDVYSKLWEDDD
mmetsp:Transcript_1898/g.5539  ORF Transcript_1898/g.5539 Transcript_1898/m.5539 type:complete len:143 (-) Transcript_1898:28-456(-)